jgi:hypothetical protein
MTHLCTYRLFLPPALLYPIYAPQYVPVPYLTAVPVVLCKTVRNSFIVKLVNIE